MLLENPLDLIVDLLNCPIRVHIPILALLVKVLDDLQRFLVVGVEALFDALDVVVGSAAGFTAFEEAVQHDFLAADQMQNEGDFHLIVHQFLPGVQVLDVPRESVDQETTALQPGLAHRSLKQHDSDLAWHDLPLHDVLLDDLTVLRTWLLPLSPQQVASRQVHELEVRLDALTDRPLPRPGSSQDEDHGCIFLHQQKSNNPNHPFHANNERSSGHDLCGPSDIRSHVVKALYRPHVPRKVTVLTAEEVVIASEVDKGKSPYATLSYEIIEDLSLRLVEVVVEEGYGDVAQIRGTEDLAKREVHVGLDGEGGEGAALPPVHAEEEERDDDDAAPDDGAHVTAEIHRLHFDTSHVDVRVDVVSGLSVSQPVQPRLQGE